MGGPVPEEKQRECSGGEARDIEKADLTALREGRLKTTLGFSWVSLFCDSGIGPTVDFYQEIKGCQITQVMD